MKVSRLLFIFIYVSLAQASQCPVEKHIFNADSSTKVSSSHNTSFIQIDIDSHKLHHYLPKNNGTYVDLVEVKRNSSKTTFKFKSSKSTGYHVDMTEAHAGRFEVDFYRSDCVPQKKFVVVIDAGHGGKDPGAISKHSNVKEKEITLAVAKKVKAQLSRNPNIITRMTRDSDIYVGLTERVKFAQKHHADLFVSLHADSFYDNAARGISLFTLSSRRAESTIARHLSGDQSISEKDVFKNIMQENQKVYGMLFDMKMSNTIKNSLDAGNKLLASLARTAQLHSKKVDQAPFAVLTSFDVPSVLIELGFLSNKQDVVNLQSKSHQSKMSGNIATAIVNYLMPGGGSYVVKRGDTLLSIAKNHKLTTNILMAKNKLKSDKLFIGQKLQI